MILLNYSHQITQDLYGSKDKLERKKKLVGELNYTGKYFLWKEKLKKSVVRLVQEVCNFFILFTTEIQSKCIQIQRRFRRVY